MIEDVRDIALMARKKRKLFLVTGVYPARICGASRQKLP
jgi:hypothetical protein